MSSHQTRGEQSHRSQPAMAGEFLSEIQSINTATGVGWVQTFPPTPMPHVKPLFCKFVTPLWTGGVVATFAVVTNLWLRLSDQLCDRGLVSPVDGVEILQGRIAGYSQPWLYPAYWGCRALGWPDPHSSLTAVLATCLATLLIYYLFLRLLARRSPTTHVVLLGLLLLFTLTLFPSLVRDTTRLKAYNDNPPQTGP